MLADCDWTGWESAPWTRESGSVAFCCDDLWTKEKEGKGKGDALG